MTPEAHRNLSRSLVAARNEAFALVTTLRRLPASREVALALTNAEQSRLWIKEALETHNSNNPIPTKHA